jgi:hypothetical protein
MSKTVFCILLPVESIVSGKTKELKNRQRVACGFYFTRRLPFLLHFVASSHDIVGDRTIGYKLPDLAALGWSIAVSGFSDKNGKEHNEYNLWTWRRH